jgi:hypothetical protein
LFPGELMCASQPDVKDNFTPTTFDRIARLRL